MSHQPLSDGNLYLKTLPYRCQHRTYHQPTMDAADQIRKCASKRIQNTDCPFRMTLKEKRSPDSFNYSLTISYHHNHPTTALQALSFRDISLATAEKIDSLFHLNYTPALAYRECLKQLENAITDRTEFQIALADRSIMPSRRDFNNLYTEYKKLKYGSENVKTMCEVLKKYIEKTTDKGYSFKLNEFSEEEEEPLILVIITPLMKRIHEKVSILKIQGRRGEEGIYRSQFIKFLIFYSIFKLNQGLYRTIKNVFENLIDMTVHIKID